MKPRSLILALSLTITAATAIRPLDDREAASYARAERLFASAPQMAGPGAEPPAEAPTTPHSRTLLIDAWLAAAAALFGRQPWLWKLCLFPFHWLLADSLYRLLLRFSTAHRGLLTWAVALSPAFLPAAGLTRELPGIALGITALQLFATAVDREPTSRRTPKRVLAAGAVGGLAGLSHGAGLLAIAPLVAYGAIYRRRRWALAATASAAAVFSTCGLLASARGAGWPGPSTVQSILSTAAPSARAVGALVPTLGASLVGVTLLALAMRRRGAALAGAGAGVFLGAIVAIARWPIGAAVFWTLGVGGIVAVGAALTRLVRGRARLLEIGHRRKWRFLAAWLVVESVYWIACAALEVERGSQGITLVATLVAARALTMSYRPPSAAAVRTAALVTALVGIGLWSLHLYTASVSRAAARLSAQRILAEQSRGDAWFDADAGFGFYASTAGLRPVVPGQAVVRTGERLVVAPRTDGRRLDAADESLIFLGRLSWDDPVRLSIVDRYADGIPLRHRGEPRFEIELYAAHHEVTLRGASPRRRGAGW